MKNTSTILSLLFCFGFLINTQSINNLYKTCITHKPEIAQLYNIASIESIRHYTILSTKISHWYAAIVTSQSLFIFLFVILAIALYLRLKHNNKIILEQKNKLEHLISLQSNIIGILGHDIKKPVVSFRKLGQKVNYLIKTKDFERLQQLGKSLEKNANNLHLLTENLLNWALEQNVTKNSTSNKVKVLPIVEEVFDWFEQEAATKRIKLNFKIKESHFVEINKNALSAIVRNLVDNAIKNTNYKGEINVSTVLKESEMILSISDNGKGMEKSKVKKILTANPKLDICAKTLKSTELGLKFIKDLLKINNGRMEVESQLKVGSKFNVYLPIVA